MWFKALILFVAVAAILGAVAPPAFHVSEETSLADILLNSPAFRNAETFNLNCIDFYVPELKVHADKYDDDVKVCQEDYQKGFDGIDATYAFSRNELFDSLRGSCSALLGCDSQTTNSGAFTCLTKTCPDEIKSINKIADNATDLNKEVVEKFKAIETTLLNCQVLAQRTYRTNHGQCLEDLNGCLDDPNWEYPASTALY
ncbi:hypothetical protein KR074_005467 [Drosophila pseudoananassae]|nr:hypothetical protein KR074_005467 [Drosophila pseudoananassae]